MIDAPTKIEQGLQDRPVAIRLGLALLGGTAVVIALAGLDHGRRADLERVTERTAVGDRAIYAVPRLPSAPVPVAWRGKALRVAGSETVELRDTEMTPAGETDGGTFRIYTPGSVKIAGEKTRLATAAEVSSGTLGLYLKAEPNEYWPVQVLP